MYGYVCMYVCTNCLRGAFIFSKRSCTACVCVWGGGCVRAGVCLCVCVCVWAACVRASVHACVYTQMIGDVLLGRESAHRFYLPDTLQYDGPARGAHWQLCGEFREAAVHSLPPHGLSQRHRRVFGGRASSSPQVRPCVRAYVRACVHACVRATIGPWMSCNVTIHPIFSLVGGYVLNNTITAIWRNVSLRFVRANEFTRSCCIKDVAHRTKCIQRDVLYQLIFRSVLGLYGNTWTLCLGCLTR